MATIQDYKKALVAADRNGDKKAAQLFANKIIEMQQADPSLIDRVNNATDVISEVGTEFGGNAAGFIASGVAGIGAGINTLIGDGKEGDAARAVQSTQAAARDLFSAKTPSGKQAMNAIVKTAAPVVQPMAEGFEQLSQASGDLAYGEAVQANTLPPKGQAAVGAVGYALPTALIELASLQLLRMSCFSLVVLRVTLLKALPLVKYKEALASVV